MFLFDNEQTYADTTAPLRAILQKGAKFVWTNVCQRSFERIKQALCSETVVGHWSQNHDRVDCPEGISATLSKGAQHKVLETNNILQQGPEEN